MQQYGYLAVLIYFPLSPPICLLFTPSGARLGSPPGRGEFLAADLADLLALFSSLLLANLIVVCTPAGVGAQRASQLWEFQARDYWALAVRAQLRHHVIPFRR